MVILSDEGGLPVYTRLLHIKESGKIITQEGQDPRNEKTILLSGLLEAIMQMKDIVSPSLHEFSGGPNKPLYIDYAKAPTGFSLVSISTSPEFQHLPRNLLSHYAPTNTNLDSAHEGWDNNLEKAIEDPLGEDAAIYRRILSKIKSELTEFVSFILVYDENGKYLFSTAKDQDQRLLSDPLLASISSYIKKEYRLRKYRDNLSLIGAKRLQDSVIWHFKCYDKIFVFFTYLIPDMYQDFDILKAEMITFISNNIEKFLDASKTHSKLSDKANKDIQSKRFIFLS